jgi:alpha-beta hydrolase superfamily lysophospholipase
MRRLLYGLAFLALLIVLALAGAIAVGPTAPPPMRSIQAAGATLDRESADLPPVRRAVARDGTALAFRTYAAAPDRVAVLIHGSSGSSVSVHGLARALQAAGVTVHVSDVRGHGESGRNGDIDYVGQLDNDIVDLLAGLEPLPAGGKRILVGHSSGGGFVLRIAGGQFGDRFDGFLMLAPYLSHDAPTVQVRGDAWAAPAIPRIIVLAILSGLGVHWFDGLPVIAFAVPAERGSRIRTPTYSFRLWANFAPHRDWQADIRNIRRPAMVLVGANDELFRADQYAPVFRALRPEIPVEMIANLDHMGPVVSQQGRAAVIKALDLLSR